LKNHSSHSFLFPLFIVITGIFHIISKNILDNSGFFLNLLKTTKDDDVIEKIPLQNEEGF